MKASEFREQELVDLAAKERELAEEVFRLRMKLKSGQLEKPSDYWRAKKDLARVKTVIREKQAAGEVK